MKFVPINNNPNVSERRFLSVSPSLLLNSLGNPCISWITKKNGHNEINYKYWDGSSWVFFVKPNFSKSKSDIVNSPNSLSLSSSNTPTIVFTTKDTNSNNLLSCAAIENGSWIIDEFQINYNPLWIGITSFDYSLFIPFITLEDGSFLLNEDGYNLIYDDVLTSSSSLSSSSSSSLDSSSSSSTKGYDFVYLEDGTILVIDEGGGFILYDYIASTSSSSSSSSVDSSSSSSIDSSSSSSSIDLSNNIVVVYGEDENIRVYLHTSGHAWTLIGSLDLGESIEDLSLLKITLTGSKIGIAYSDGETIKYNFFDAFLKTWSFASFQILPSSIIANTTIVDFSICSTYASGLSSILFAWSINGTSYSTLKYATIDESGTETSQTVETFSTPIVLSNGFMPNGYRALSMCLDGSSNPKIFASGTISALFSKSGSVWSKTLVDISGSSTFLPSNMTSAFDTIDGITKICFCNNGDNIYYYEESAIAGFDEYFPQISVLNEKRLYISNWTSGILSGSQVFGSYNTMVCDMLKDSINKVSVFIGDEDPYVYSSSSSSSVDSSSSSSSSSLEYSSSSSSIGYSSASSGSSSSSEEYSSSSSSENYSSSSSSYINCKYPVCNAVGSECISFTDWEIDSAGSSKFPLYVSLFWDGVTQYVSLCSHALNNSTVASGNATSSGIIILTEQNSSGVSGLVTWDGTGITSGSPPPRTMNLECYP